MTTETVIKKYGLKLVEKNGRKGVAPSFGKMTAADVDYIRSHKDEIIAALTAAVTPKVVSADPALKAYVKVAEAEYLYHLAERNADSNTTIISARDAYFAALAQWQKDYPEAAAVSRTNNLPSDPWNI